MKPLSGPKKQTQSKPISNGPPPLIAEKPKFTNQSSPSTDESSQDYQQIELRNRQAINKGQKRYDTH